MTELCPPNVNTHKYLIIPKYLRKQIIRQFSLLFNQSQEEKHEFWISVAHCNLGTIRKPNVPPSHHRVFSIRRVGLDERETEPWHISSCSCPLACPPPPPGHYGPPQSRSPSHSRQDFSVSMNCCLWESENWWLANMRPGH